jgi:uncharacterized membrane protein
MPGYLNICFFLIVFQPGRYLSDIGGVLGLWIGFSILTVAEFIELGMDFIVCLGSRLNKNNKEKTAATDTGVQKSVSTAQLQGSARWYHVKSPPPAPGTDSKHN